MDTMYIKNINRKSKRQHLNSLLLALFLLLLAPCASLLFTSCDNYMDDKEPENDGHISFFTENMAPTRGTQLTELSSFGVSAATYASDGSYATAQCANYFRDIEVNATTGTSDYYWPSSEYHMAFYAYAPYNHSAISLAAASTTGRMQYTYTVPDEVANHPDLVTAEQLDVTCPSTSPVSLTFNHQLTCIAFTLDNSTVDDITVNSITIKNMKYVGTLTGTSWETTSAVKDVTLTVGEELASGASMSLTGTSNNFFMIPQTVASGTLLLDLSITVNEEIKHFTYNLPSAFTTVNGRSYTFTLRLTEDLIVDNSADQDIDDWELEVSVMENATTTTTTDWTMKDGVPIDHNTTSITDWTEAE